MRKFRNRIIMVKTSIFSIMAILVVIFIPSICISATSEPGDEPYEITSVDQKPGIAKSFPPDYPSEAKANNISGKVIVKFVVTKEGKAKDYSIIDSVPPGVFDESALAAIKEYRFTPALKDGIPVDVVVHLPITFGLRDDDSGGYSPRSVSLSNKGLDHYKKGKYEKAIELFSKALKISPGFHGCYSNRGLAYIQIKDYAAAIDDFNKAIDLAPEERSYYISRGNAYDISGEYNKAITDYSKAIDMSPSLVRDYLVRGEALKNAERYNEAIQDFSTAIGIDENCMQAYKGRAFSYYKLGDNEAACIDYKKACELGDCRAYDALEKAGICLSPTLNKKN